MPARDENAQLSAQKRNKNWFEERLVDAGLTKQNFADKLDLAPSLVSRSLAGTPPLVTQARVLNLDMATLLRMLGLEDSLPSAAQVRIMYRVTAGGELIGLPAGQRTKTVLPPEVPSRAVAAHCNLGNTAANNYDGWVLYYLPPDNVDRRALGRLAVIKIEDEAAQRVGFVKQRDPVPQRERGARRASGHGVAGAVDPVLTRGVEGRRLCK